MSVPSSSTGYRDEEKEKRRNREEHMKRERMWTTVGGILSFSFQIIVFIL
jgi:hypothetical protein